MTVPSNASVLTGKPSPAAQNAFARGILSEPFPLAGGVNVEVLNTQEIVGCVVPVQLGTTVSGLAVCVCVAAAGTLPTAVYVAICDLTGVRLAVSADVKALANWNTVGPRSFAFTTPWSVTADGAVYAVILKNGVYGTTEPKIAVGGDSNGTVFTPGIGLPLGANAAGAVHQTGQTTIPTTATLTGNDLYPWLALV